MFSRSHSRSTSQTNPLLQTTTSYSLHDLSPHQEFTTSTPSPPPSFYHDNINASPSPSPSPSRTTNTNPARRIQFAAPPPPIATSVLLPPRNSSKHVSRDGSPQLHRSRGSLGMSMSADPLIALERRETAIQGELQVLLDAQASGLALGSSSGISEEGSEGGSRTPTGRSMNGERESKRVVPVRQPKRRHISLRGARRGLLRDMEELVAVKDEETGVLGVEIEKREEVLGMVGKWEVRIQGAREQLVGYNDNDNIQGGEESAEIAELRTEERALDAEIREVEDRLAQMKAKRRWLGEQIKESVNKREARLSSYRGALREMEGQVREFLKRPPVGVSVVMGGEEGFYGLPASRRTLGMAREWWGKEVAALGDKKEETEKEKRALEEGAGMWEGVVGVVGEFEDGLRRQMKSGEVQDKQMFRGQISKMAMVIEKLKDVLQTAEERGWNLLICAVGAELQAFTEGESLLKGALEMAEEQQKDDDEPGGVATNGLEELKDPGNGFVPETSQARERERDSVEREESEDDGPNLAELMIDHGSGDTDEAAL